MNSYGCDGTSGLPPGLDASFTMCTHTFFDCDWVNSSLPMGQQLVHTGNTSTPGCENGECYTTSVMGNASVDWIRSVIADKMHPPFYAWIGPHAPHLPSTPAPWCDQLAYYIVAWPETSKITLRCVFLTHVVATIRLSS